MTVKELRKVLEALPDNQRIGFNLCQISKAKDDISEEVEAGNSCISVEITGYTRECFGEDQLFFFDLITL